MINEKYGHEWFELAVKHLSTAQILYDANHYTDIIGIELQQSIERYLKALLAYYSFKIPRTHDLVEIYKSLQDILQFDEDHLEILDIATTYFTDTRYPGNNYFHPDRKEIQRVLFFVRELDKIVSDIIVAK